MRTQTGLVGKDVLALDVDGVVVHPRDSLGSWDRDIEQDLGINPKVLSAGFFRPYWTDVVEGRLGLASALGEFLTAIGSPVSTQTLIAYWFERDGSVDLEVVEAAQQWRASAKNRAVVAVSNQEPLRVQYLLTNLGLQALFDFGIWSSSIGVSKKTPEFYRLVNKDILTGSRQVLFFDDEQKHVDMARLAGWSAELFVSAHAMSNQLVQLEGGCP